MKMCAFYKILFAVLLCAAFVAVFAACENNDDTAAQLVDAQDFAIEEQTLSATVSNATDSFSFIGKITVSEGATWQISTDITGRDIVPSKTVPIKEGDNTFYLLITSGDGAQTSLYTVIVRRKPLYAVIFDTAGGTQIESQQIEENDYATAPTVAPTRAGYTFAGWDYDFAMPVTDARTIVAKWTANTYTIIYNANNGSVDKTRDTVTYNATFTLPTPTRAGYAFQGWYQDDIQYTSGVWTRASDVVLTARWQAIYTISGHTITGVTNYAKNNVAELTVPLSIDGVAITAIGNSAFLNYTALRSITIFGSVTSIGTWAFLNCSGLTSVTIENGVTSIGDSAFDACSSLISITIPNSVTHIGVGAFSACNRLTSITIPNSVTNLGNYAFSLCFNLTNITYQGTKAQWNAISKGSDWNANTGAYVIHCTDGDIAK